MTGGEAGAGAGGAGLGVGAGVEADGAGDGSVAEAEVGRKFDGSTEGDELVGGAVEVTVGRG